MPCPHKWVTSFQMVRTTTEFGDWHAHRFIRHGIEHGRSDELGCRGELEKKPSMKTERSLHCFLKRPSFSGANRKTQFFGVSRDLWAWFKVDVEQVNYKNVHNNTATRFFLNFPNFYLAFLFHRTKYYCSSRFS